MVAGGIQALRVAEVLNVSEQVPARFRAGRLGLVVDSFGLEGVEDALQRRGLRLQSIHRVVWPAYADQLELQAIAALAQLGRNASGRRGFAIRVGCAFGAAIRMLE